MFGCSRIGTPFFLAAVASMVLTGCTMCPSPFDYSGPVPNGSAAQNDFRARSNGIIPIGGSPRPWPPLVKQNDGNPTLAAQAENEEVALASAASEAEDVDSATE